MEEYILDILENPAKMNIFERLQRKGGSLFHRLLISPSQRKLDLSNPQQVARFKSLAQGFSQQLEQIPKNDLDQFVTPFWHQFNAQLLKTLYPIPPLDFLRNPIISSTMVVTREGALLKTELAYLEHAYQKTTLKDTLYEDPVGKPLIVNSEYRTSHNSIHHTYHLARFFKTTRTTPDSFSTIIEWGGGYGNLAKIYRRLTNRPHTWIILDTPLFSTLQWLYLSSIFGEKIIRLITHPNQEILSGGINLLPITLVKEFNLNADLFISTWAISESSIASQDFVAKERNWFHAPHLLLSYQENSAVLPAAERIGTIAKTEGATLEDIPHMPGQHYAFR